MHARVVVLSLLAACAGERRASVADAPEVEGQVDRSHNAIDHVFVIAFENQDAKTIYNTPNAPYLHALMETYAYATAYGDDYLAPNLPSEPHYIQMEAGTNTFGDKVFESDWDPSSGN